MPDQVDWRTMEREASPGRAVGRLLRDQREARGLTIGDVEKRLRIRCHQLEAIEQGRFELLPGAAYVPAFLRAYAQLVGLDPGKVLTAYHLSGAVPIKRPIALPADFPLVERRAPIGLAVLTVLLVIGAGYAVWHYLPRQQTVVAEKVPPVPDRLLASRPDATPASEPATNVATPIAVATTPAAATPATAPAATAPVPPPMQSQEVRSGSQPLPPETWPAPRQESSAAPPAPPIVVTVPAAPPPVVMSAPAIGQAQAAQQPPAETQRPNVQRGDSQRPDTVRPDTARIVTQPIADVQEATARAALPDAMLTAPMKTDTQLFLRTNSWIELRAPNGDVLAQTYVRGGESYTVPAGIAYRIIDAR